MLKRGERKKQRHNSTTEILRFSAKINKLYWSKNTRIKITEKHIKRFLVGRYSALACSMRYAVVYCFQWLYNNSINADDAKSCIYLYALKSLCRQKARAYQCIIRMRLWNSRAPHKKSNKQCIIITKQKKNK